MPNRAKQQREKRRQNSRDVMKVCTRRLLDRQFEEFTRDYIMPVLMSAPQPFYDAIRRRDAKAFKEMMGVPMSFIQPTK